MSGLYLALAGSVGLNNRQCEKRCRQLEVSCQFSPFDVVDDGGMRLGKQRWYDEADALARARRGEAHHMLRPVMA